ncbi:acyl-CoA N-acyltransferase [Aspergillus desertorum]
MSRPQKPSSPQPLTKVTLTLFDVHDLPSISQIWTSALPQYPLPQETLNNLLPQSNGHHLVARLDGGAVGFCLSYASRHQAQKPIDATKGYIAVLAVRPEYQRRGVGTALLKEAIARFRNEFGPCHIEVGSAFPRFWPGVPVSGPLKFFDSGFAAGSGSTEDQDRDEDKVSPRSACALDFFINRGFRICPEPPRSVDLYRDISNFSLTEKGDDHDYAQRARGAGYTFSALQADGYEECLAGQRRNFAYNPDWIDIYHNLDPASHPSSIMTAFDVHGAQVGWTLMLSPSSSLLQSNWAMPSVCGPNTGLIGCVGIDKDHRESGVGIALVAHALRDMKDRGIEGVFVDWVSLEGFYEKVGFDTWARYRTGGIG